MQATSGTLRRSLSLPAIALYGLGTTIGAGIYALTGEVAGAAGYQAWLAFLVASVLAAASAASFAEMAYRLPRCAGEAVYVRAGLGWPRVATAVGLVVALAGCVSSGTVANAFVGYLGELVEVPRAVGIAGFVVLLAALAAWGVRESVWAAGVITAVELGGLLLVVAVAGDSLATLPARAAELAPRADAAVWAGVFAASLLAFYAFIGFEDMVNMAEEVRDVRRTLPRAIAITLVVTMLLYVLLGLVAVLAVPPEELARAGAPLVEIYQRGGGRFPALLSGIGVVAMLNGALIQIIMASRVLYGLASQGEIPAVLARVHPRRRTPHVATGVAGGLVLVLALGFPLAALARATSLLTLSVFALVNLALFRLQGREPLPDGVRGVPRSVPLLGFVSSTGFIVLEGVRRLG